MRYLLIILLGLMLATPALADRGGGGDSAGGGGHGGGQDGAPDGSVDHDRARRAVENHQILPLQRVLASVHRAHGGRVIEVELEHNSGRYLYELKLVTTDGRILELEVDAATGVMTDGVGKGDSAGED